MSRSPGPDGFNGFTGGKARISRQQRGKKTRYGISNGMRYSSPAAKAFPNPIGSLFCTWKQKNGGEKRGKSMIKKEGKREKKEKEKRIKVRKDEK